MNNEMGYSLFPVKGLLHGGHIRPYMLCKEMGISLKFQRTRHIPPSEAVISVARKNIFLLFLGYNADHGDLLLSYLMKLRGCKTVLDVADIPYLQYQEFYGKPSPKSILDFGRLLRLSDVLLFTTTSMMYVAKELLDLSDKKLVIVENASDPSHFHPSPLPERNVISYVGAYVPARGIDELIEAFRIIKRQGLPCSLKIVSSGFPVNHAEEGLEVWRSLYYDKIPSIFESTDIFVIPHRPGLYASICAPLKLFDAMAAGRPVVATNCEETRRIIEEEKCGIVTDFDPKSMADAILYLFENPSEAREMGQRGRRAVEKRYSWKIMGAQIRRIMQES